MSNKVIHTRNYWNKTSNLKNFINSFATEIGIENQEDWYKVKGNDFIERDFGALLRKYSSSVSNLIQNAYPEVIWKPYKFYAVPNGFWKNKQNQRNAFVDVAITKLNIKNFEQLYKVSIDQIKETKTLGYGFIHENSSSPPQIGVKLFPEYNFLPWKFHRNAPNFWKFKTNITDYFKYLEKILEIEKFEDWNFIKIESIRKYYGFQILLIYGGLEPLLKIVYNKNTSKTEFSRNIPKTQMILYKKICSLFPNQKIDFNYKHSSLILPDSKKKLEIDIFIPELKLGFEYQGIQHYEKSWFNPSNPKFSKIDKIKKKICKKNNITLIDIPYWWDESIENLKELINNKSKKILNK